VLIKEKAEAEKIVKLIAKVNIMLVLLFLFLWPSRFLFTKVCNFRSFLQQVFIVIHNKRVSNGSKSITDMKVNPTIIMSNNKSKMKKNHTILL